MREITKQIKDTNASFRELGAGDAKNTDLFLDGDMLPFFDGKDAIKVRLHKDNLSQAILFIASNLPKKFDSSSVHKQINYTADFVKESLAVLDGFFVKDDNPVSERVVVWNVRCGVAKKNGEIDNRFYLNNLIETHTYTDLSGAVRTNRFTIRDYLMGGYSSVKFIKDDGSDIFDFQIINSATPFTTDAAIYRTAADYKKYVALLKAKKNLILTGAPGTGKTYIAKQVAASIVSDGSAEWSGLSGDQREQVGFVQFHPSFDYTDFVEGLRPDKSGSFSRQDGIFKEFCKKAINNPEDKFVFIIDEINRGELSKIFGELFYSIEPDYRGIEGRVKTQYINMVDDGDEFKEGFYIPENVYIIGTMNDVDRGVEAMDFAIRRRFAWKEVTAEESAANMGITGDALAKMNKINEVIKEKLGQAYCIGGAYFRKLDGDNFADLWDNHLSGIVTEYFRGEPEADARIAEIKTAYDAAEAPKEEPAPASAPAETETTPAAE